MGMISTTFSSVAKAPARLINRDFALLWTGQAISNIGDFVFTTTLILWVATVIAAGQRWSPLAVSGVTLAAALPMLIVGPLAGVFVDRWDKRLTMLWADGLRALLVAALVLLTVPVRTPWFTTNQLPSGWLLGAIYAVVFLESASAQFFNPARFTLIGDIVPEADRPRAASLTQITGSVALIVGPPLAAPLLFSFGVQWALAINALSFLVSFLAVFAVMPGSRGATAPVHAGSPPAASYLGELAAGLRYFGGNAVLMTITIANVLVVLGFGALESLLVFFMTGNLHATPSLFGVVSTSIGAGAIVGALLAAPIVQRLGNERVFWLSLIAFGVGILVLARLVWFVPAVAVLFLLGLPNSALKVASGPLILQATPREYLGRVLAVLTPVTSVSFLIAATGAGFLASNVVGSLHASILGISFGTIDMIYSMAGLLVIAGGLFAMFNLRRPAPATTAAATRPGEELTTYA